jgi:N-acetyl-anhydromuramyl-L-alanine amidase AmpD
MSIVLDKGMDNDFVGNWQRTLLAQKSLSGTPYAVGKVDDKFGEKTHNATLAFQADRGLIKTGRVDWNTWLHVGSEPSPVTVSHKGVQFIQSKNFTKANRTEVRWIVLHTMEAAEASTTAVRTAQWFASASAPQASCHYCVDDVTVVQCVETSDVAWHAPGANRFGIGIEHAGYARQTPAEWADSFSQRMLDLSANLSAGLAAKWSIPIRFVKAAELVAGEPGFTTHYEVSKAFKKSDHWDPGPNFPMDAYLERVRNYTERL